MTLYGKTAATAIAVMTFLAQHPRRRCGSFEISEARSISRPLTAKVLTQLATAGLVQGTPGPGGGYTLTRDPSAISLLQTVSLFENTETPAQCPFGPEWCGTGRPCPMHDDLIALMKRNRAFLEDTSLSAFVPSEPVVA